MTTLRQNLAPVSPFSVTLSPIARAIPQGSPVTGPMFGPVETVTYSGSESWNDFSIEGIGSFEIVNETPDYLEVDGNQLLRKNGIPSINNGSILLKGSYGFGKRIPVTFNHVPTNTIIEESSFVTGSHPSLAWDIIKPLLDSGGDVSLFSTVNHASGTYTPNASCWAKDFDFSGVSVWNSRTGDFRRACTLITRRHIRFAWHYKLLANDVVKFRGADGTLHSYTVLAILPGETYESGTHHHYTVNDCGVAVLDRDVDASIRHYPITGDWIHNIDSLPSESYPLDPDSPYGSWPSLRETPSINLLFGQWVDGSAQRASCGLRLNQHRQVFVFSKASLQEGSMNILGTESTYEGETLPIYIQHFETANGPPSQPLVKFMESYADAYAPGWAVEGDSGSPIFYPLTGNNLALIALQMSATFGHNHTEALLNALIRVVDAVAGISTGLTVTVAPDPTL